jgi:predicted nucleic acid-binding protein
MSPPVFLDANVPIYAAGRPHPLKAPCVRVLELAAERPRDFVTDAEVLQELLHRYRAMKLWPAGHAVLTAFAELMDGQIEPVHAVDVTEAASGAYGHAHVAARDLLHAAVMRRLGAHRIVSADRDFDSFDDFDRLDPADVDSWVASLDDVPAEA